MTQLCCILQINGSGVYHNHPKLPESGIITETSHRDAFYFCRQFIDKGGEEFLVVPVPQYPQYRMIINNMSISKQIKNVKHLDINSYGIMLNKRKNVYGKCVLFSIEEGNGFTTESLAEVRKELRVRIPEGTDLPFTDTIFTHELVSDEAKNKIVNIELAGGDDAKKRQVYANDYIDFLQNRLKIITEDDASILRKDIHQYYLIDNLPYRNVVFSHVWWPKLPLAIDICFCVKNPEIKPESKEDAKEKAMAFMKEREKNSRYQ
jgi:hypothetical protein